MSHKLYVWRPDGHGEYSFITSAKSKEDSIAQIEKYIEEHKNKDDGHYLDDYSIAGWGTDYYTLEVFNLGDVITNENS